MELMRVSKISDSDEGFIVYLPHKNGYFWTQRSGNRIIYHGPFRTNEAAERAMERENAHR